MAHRLDNSEIATVFVEMADLTHIVGEDPHRIRAFRRAARVIENLPTDVETAIRYGTFEKTPGIGPGTVRRAKQILRTGSCDDLRELRRRLPPGLRELLDVKGIGASTARRLWQHLKVASIGDLELAIRTGALLRVPRMGQRTAEKLMKALDDHRRRIGRVPYVEARRIGMRLVEGMREHPEVQRVALAGSLRRGKATTRDLDVLVASEDRAKAAARFVTLPDVAEVMIRGEGRAQVRLHNGQQADLRVLPPENWGAGLHYFTGSQLHNIALRTRGLKVTGLKISDKGVFVRDTEILVHPATDEADVFTAARLPFVEPELRENTGEIEAAAAGRLPRLVSARDLRGDLHMHTVASDGKGTAEEMARSAAALGHSYIAITDHTKSLEVANGLDERRLLAQRRHLRELQDRLGELRIAAGTEVDILPDGSLDLDLDVLRGQDWVIASVHAAFEMTGEQMTRRLIAAMETGVVDCIGHPTGRRLGQRGGAELDWEALFAAARRMGVAIEINGNPYRMDLPDVGCRRAHEMGVVVAVNTDAHAPKHLAYQEFGLVTARRGWIEARDVLNTRPWEAIAEMRRDRLRQRGVSLAGASPAPAPGPEPPGVAIEAPAPAAVEHWPEDAQTRSVVPEPEFEPGELARDAVPPPPEEVGDLVAALRARPLDEPLRERLDNWLRHGGDEPLEAALRQLGDNPMQTAFGLLFAPE